MALHDEVFDAISVADNIDATMIAVDDKEVITFRCTFDIKLNRETNDILAKTAKLHGHTAAKAVRRMVKLGFRACFSEEQDEPK